MNMVTQRWFQNQVTQVSQLQHRKPTNMGNLFSFLKLMNMANLTQTVMETLSWFQNLELLAFQLLSQ